MLDDRMMPRGQTARHFRRVHRSFVAAVRFGPVYTDYAVRHSDMYQLSGYFYRGDCSKGFSRFDPLMEAVSAMLPGDPPLQWDAVDDDVNMESLRIAAYKAAEICGFKVHVSLPKRGTARHILVVRDAV